MFISDEYGDALNSDEEEIRRLAEERRQQEEADRQRDFANTLLGSYQPPAPPVENTYGPGYDFSQGPAPPVDYFTGGEARPDEYAGWAPANPYAELSGQKLDLGQYGLEGISRLGANDPKNVGISKDQANSNAGLWDRFQVFVSDEYGDALNSYEEEIRRLAEERRQNPYAGLSGQKLDLGQYGLEGISRLGANDPKNVGIPEDQVEERYRRPTLWEATKQGLAGAVSANKYLKAMSGGDVSLEGLPSPLYEIADPLLSPVSLASMGSGTWGGVAGNVAKNIAAIGAGLVTHKGMEKYSQQDWPGADIAGSPWLQIPAELAAGVVGYGVTGRVGAAAAKRMGMGDLVGEDLRFPSQEDNSISLGESSRGQQVAQAIDAHMAEFPASPGELPEAAAQVPAVSVLANGKRYEVPDIGTAGIDAALKAKLETLRAPGAAFEALPTPIRKSIGLIDPMKTMPREVAEAHSASVGVRAMLETQYAARMEPLVNELEKALKESPPVYRGPTKNPIANTWKDIADHPDFYELSPPVRVAMETYDQGQWAIAADVRARFGVDVAPYDNGIEGAIYAPTVLAKQAAEEKILSDAYSGLGAKARTQERAYAGAFERMAADPAFVPETGLRELTDIHTSAMARNAANATFRQGAGGLTKTELMEQTHPALFARYLGLRQRLESLKGSTDRLSSRTSEAIDSFLANPDPESVDWEALRADLSPKVRANALGVQGRNFGKNITDLREEIQQTKEDIRSLAQAWRTADPARGTDYVLNRNLYRYVKPQASKAVDSLVGRPGSVTQALINIGDEARALHLAGDASPFTIQGVLGMASSPVSTAKTVVSMIGREDPRLSLLRIAREQPQDVADYTFATGRRFGQFGAGEYDTAKGLGHIPAFKALEDKMFATVQRIQFEGWKADRDYLLSANPEMSRTVAAAESANTWSRLIPSLNPAERAISPARKGMERLGLTSTSFAVSPALLMKDVASGMAKLAIHTAVNPDTAWQSLAGREQLAIRRGMTLAGSLLAASASSAALSAASRGISIEDAIKESLNPNSRYFVALQLGQGRSVPVGGPFRSLVKMLLPGQNGVPFENLGSWIRSRLNTPVATPLDIVRNKDFTDRPIYYGNAFRPDNVLRSLLYGAENLVPLGVGQTMTDIRTGMLTTPLPTMKELLGTLQRTGGQFAGANLSLASDRESRDMAIRSAFKGGQTWDGKEIKGWNDLEPWQQQQWLTEHGKVYSRDPETLAKQQAADTIRASAAKAQTQAEAAFRQDISKEGAGQTFRDAMGKIEAQLRGSFNTLYPPDSSSQTVRVDPLSQYFEAMKRFTDPQTGKVEYSLLDQYYAGLKPEEQSYIARNMGISETGLWKQYHDDMKLLDESGLWKAESKLKFLLKPENAAALKIADMWDVADRSVSAAKEFLAYRDAQLVDDKAFDAGKMEGKDWRDAYRDRQRERSAALSAIYGPGGSEEPKTETEKQLAAYSAFIDSTRATPKSSPDWKRVDAYKAQHPELQQALKAREPLPQTEIEGQFQRAEKYIEQSHYWDLQDSLAKQWANYQRLPRGLENYDDVERYIKTEYARMGERAGYHGLALQDAVDREAGQLMKPLDDAISSQREDLRHGDIRLLDYLVRWGYKKPTVEEADWLRRNRR